MDMERGNQVSECSIIIQQQYFTLAQRPEFKVEYVLIEQPRFLVNVAQLSPLWFRTQRHESRTFLKDTFRVKFQIELQWETSFHVTIVSNIQCIVSVSSDYS